MEKLRWLGRKVFRRTIIAGSLAFSISFLAIWVAFSGGKSAEAETEAKPSEEPVIEKSKGREEPVTPDEVSHRLDVGPSAKQTGTLTPGARPASMPQTAQGEEPGRLKNSPGDQGAALKACLEAKTRVPEPPLPKRNHDEARRRPRKAARPMAIGNGEAASNFTDPGLAPRKPKTAAFYQAGVVLGAAQQKKPGSGSRIPPGTRIQAKLVVGISTDYRGARVLARTTQPVRQGQEVLLAEGTTLTGDFQGAKERIYLDFRSARVAGAEAFPIQAYAVTDGLPGVPARVIRGKDKASKKTSGVVTRGALRTAQGLARRIPGTGLAADLTGNLANEALREVPSRGFQNEGPVLELPAGTELSLVVVE